MGKKNTWTWFITRISLYSLSHCKLYNLKCGTITKLYFSTKVMDATLVQLPLLMIIPHTLSWIWHLVWKMFSHCSSLMSTCAFKTRCTTNKSPSTSSKSSLCSFYSISSSTLVSDSSLLTNSPCFLCTTITLLFRHLEAICLCCKHLKHLMSRDLLGCWGSITFSLSFVEFELVLPLLNPTFSSRLDAFHVYEDVEIGFEAFNAFIALPSCKHPKEIYMESSILYIYRIDDSTIAADFCIGSDAVFTADF